MAKLSPAQVAILRRMAVKGDHVGYVSRVGRGQLHWVIRYTRPYPAVPLRHRSIEILRDVGFIEQCETQWWGHEYAITPAGRAYLEGLE